MTSFIFVLFIGLIIRLFLVGNPGFIADISFWKSWSLAAVDHGIVWTTFNTNINYPPGFIYVLYVMGKIYSFLGNPHDYNAYWLENNFAFLLASKSIAIVSDIIISCIIYWFFSQKEKLKQLGMLDLTVLIPNRRKPINESSLGNVSSFEFRVSSFIGKHLPLFLASAFYLNPIVIIDSALWGQVESFGILFTIIAILLIFYRRPVLAVAIFTVGTLMKLQNIIYIPLFFLFIARYYDIKTLIKCLASGVFTFFLINLPFVLSNNMNQVIYLLTVNSDYFPWLSLNAHNLWWIVAGAQGMQITDRITVLGIINAKTLGLLIFSSFYLLSTILIYFKPSFRNFLLSLTFSIFAFFLFSTQSHERYSYPVIVFLIFLYPFVDNLLSKANRQSNPLLSERKHLFFQILYLLLTISFFFNIHTGLILNYPTNGIFFLTKITTPVLTIVNSYALIFLFIALLPFIFSQISKSFLFIPVIFLTSALTFLHWSYLSSGKVSLTSFNPIVTKQDFGILQTDMSTNSSAGWKKWSRLSSNYFFYRKGFGVHANSYLVFDINRKFSRFATDLGVDTEADTPASVVFKIYADGKELYQSGKMGRFDFPKHTQVDVKKVKRLELVVTDAGDGINSDHADWLNPVLYK